MSSFLSVAILLIAVLPHMAFGESVSSSTDQAPGGESVVLQSDGSIVFADKTNKTVFVIPALFMYDAAGECSDAVYYTLTSTPDGWRVSITADTV